MRFFSVGNNLNLCLRFQIWFLKFAFVLTHQSYFAFKPIVLLFVINFRMGKLRWTSLDNLAKRILFVSYRFVLFVSYLRR